MSHFYYRAAGSDAVFETGLKIKGDMLQNGWGVDLSQDSTTDTIGLNFITITILQLYSGW